MGRKPIPISSRDAIARDQKLVIMLTKNERDRYEAAMVRLGYGTMSDMIRDAIDRRITDVTDADQSAD